MRGSVWMSTPLMPTCIEPVSDTSFAQPRPRSTANAISGSDFVATSSACW